MNRDAAAYWIPACAGMTGDVHSLHRTPLYLGPTILVRSDINPSNEITMSSPGCR
jgi:hypothetical protein